MKPRVIHIQCHTAPFTKEHVYYGWAARTARYMHTYAKGYENECFYAVTSIKQEKIWKEDGITYHLFKPRDRIEARRKLGLPLKKTIFLFVGRFDRTKGVKEIIDAHLKIKEA